MHSTDEAKIINLCDRRDRTQVAGDWPVQAGEHDIDGHAPVLQTAVMAALGFRTRRTERATTTELFCGRPDATHDADRPTTVAELFRTAAAPVAAPMPLPLRKVA